jgi:hypothetical protein
MTSQTITNATVLAGDIVRYDFVLNSGVTAADFTAKWGLDKGR